MRHLPVFAFLWLMITATVQIIFLFKKSLPQTFIKRFFFKEAYLAGTVLLLTELIIRSVILKTAAVASMYEVILLLSALILLAGYLIFARLFHDHHEISPAVTITAAALLAVSFSPLVSSEIIPPLPILRSNWLYFHIGFAFIGEAFFALSFLTAGFYFIKKKQKFVYFTDLAISLGYPFYTTGALLFGMIWAYSAWGRFWDFDPKETWALITWLNYTFFIHLRFFKNVRQEVRMAVAVFGFILTLFTFFGVNYLLPGLHSYR